jgi:uncharacterized protein
MKLHAIRLKPDHDLKMELIKWAFQNKIKAACIISGLGSLKSLNIRFAGGTTGTRLNGLFEIVSFEGTFSKDNGHFHICLSNDKGETLGGHLLEENIIYTTAEIIIAELIDFTFSRLPDSETGYNELHISKQNTQKHTV